MPEDEVKDGIALAVDSAYAPSSAKQP
jgi:hypothetical protein